MSFETALECALNGPHETVEIAHTVDFYGLECTVTGFYLIAAYNGGEPGYDHEKLYVKGKFVDHKDNVAMEGLIRQSQYLVDNPVPTPETFMQELTDMVISRLAALYESKH